MRSGIVLAFTVCLLSFTVHAQDYLVKRGDKAYSYFQYSKAADYYKDALSGSDEAAVKVKLAKAYKMMGDPVSAVFWFEAGKEALASHPEAMLMYAMALQQSGRTSEAQQWYSKYHDLRPDDQRGHMGVRAIEQMPSLKDRPGLYNLEVLNGLNSSSSEFGPAWNQGNLVFSSDRNGSTNLERSLTVVGTAFHDLYSSSQNLDFSWDAPVQLQGSAATPLHDGPVSFCDETDEVFFTRNQYVGGFHGGEIRAGEDQVVRLAVMVATRKGNTWSEPTMLPFNSVDHNVAHPSISSDGNALYFASDALGGFGGSDIYVAYRRDGQWSSPINLGASVNTSGDEMFPFIAEDGSLYFASNTHPGIGGLDVFRAFWDKSNKSFGRVWNLGVPINSSGDDFAFVIDDENQQGFFSSNRSGGKGSDDIYGCSTVGIFYEVSVRADHNHKPIEGAWVEITLEGNDVVKGKTDQDGRFMYVLAKGHRYDVKISDDRYHGKELVASTKAALAGDVIYDEVFLKSSLNIVASGIVIGKQYKSPIRGATVTLLNTMTGETMTHVTDHTGLFRFELGPDAAYELEASKAEFTTASRSFNTNGVDADKQYDFTLEIEGPEDLSIAFHHVYFDLDKATLRKAAIKELDRMAEVLRLSPTLRVEVSAHTDSRASYEYNKRLSQRRAKAVVNYMISKGIDKSRMISQGYGESRLLNKCKDGVPCTEQQHQRNRRVEFAVIDKDNNIVTESNEDKDYVN